MENNINKHGEILPDLVHILADRIKIYTEVISSIDTNKEVDFIAFFEKCMQLSQQFKTELLAILPKEDALPPEKQQTTGELYKQWKAEKSALKSTNGQEALAACEKMEATILHMLKQILSDKDDYNEDTAAIIKSQVELQQELYEQLRFMRKGDDESNRKL